MAIDPLYIGEPNTIFCEINNRDGTPVTGATVTFTVKDMEGVTVGTANVAMAYNATFIPDPTQPQATIEAYVGTYSATDALLLEKATDGEANYEVWITASGYTLRVLPRAAQYRGRN